MSAEPGGFAFGWRRRGVQPNGPHRTFAVPEDPERRSSPAATPLEQLAARIADGEVVDWRTVSAMAHVAPAELAALDLLDRIGRAGRAHAASTGPDFVPDGYLVDGFLGRGSYGKVFRAHEVALDRPVALKILDPLAGLTADDRRRFLREARLLARIDHRNVARIYAVHESGERIALSLELVVGQTLDRLLENRSRLPVEEAVQIVQDLCAALGVLHAQGIVHRDVKPANVMRADGGRAVLLDFGVARLAGDGPLGPVAGSFGTPEFAAPELRAGSGGGARADVFSLGVLLHWLVTGALPSDATSGVRVPRGLLAIASKAAGADPGARFAGVGELARALASWRRRSRLLAGAVRGFGVGLLVSALAASAWLVWPRDPRFPWQVRANEAAARAARAGQYGGLHEWLAYEPTAVAASEVGTGVPAPRHLEFAVPFDANRLIGDRLVHRVPQGYQTIQAAIDGARDGDAIVIAPDTYRERIDLGRKALALVGIGGPENTVLDGSAFDDSVLTIGVSGEPSNARVVTIAGLTFTGGAGKVIDSKMEPRGGAIYVFAGTLNVQHCVLYGSGLRGATFGGAIACNQDLVRLQYCLLYGNAAWASGGAILVGGVGSLEVKRCTIVGNTSRDFYGCQGGIGLAQSGRATIVDSILWGNAGEQIEPFIGYGPNTRCYVDPDASLAQGWGAQQPLFEDPEAGDFRLRPAEGLVGTDGRARFGAMGVVR